MNYCYHTGAQAALFYEGWHFNPIMNAGGSSTTIDDFNANWDFDRGRQGYVGGFIVAGAFNTALPIGYRPGSGGTPAWGTAWQTATAQRQYIPLETKIRSSVLANPKKYVDRNPAV